MAKRAMLSVNSGVQDTLILDSGATGHYLKHRTYFTKLNPINSEVYAANGQSISILGEGPAVIPAESGPIHVAHAYYIPELFNSLLLLTKFIQAGFSVWSRVYLQITQTLSLLWINR